MVMSWDNFPMRLHRFQASVIAFVQQREIHADTGSAFNGISEDALDDSTQMGHAS